MRIKRPKVYEIMHDAGFLYRGKTITKRTVRTMFDNKFFDSIEWSDLGRCWTVLESEILKKIEDAFDEDDPDLIHKYRI